MVKLLAKLDLKDKLAYLILLFIGFQQFPVIRVGGSLKLYEVFALALMAVMLLTARPTQIRIFTLLAFLFFVVSPVFSYLYSVFFLGYPKGFYLQYPGAAGFKFNFYLFPVLQLLYMFFNFAAIEGIYSSRKLYAYFEQIVKNMVIVGTIISVYSITASLTVDVIHMLPNFIQNKALYHFRSSGLSQEPSFYVLYQSWICLFSFYAKALFSRQRWLIVTAINCLSLVLTFSTSLVGLIGVIFLSLFILKTSFKVKLRAAVASLLAVGTVVSIIFYFDLYPLFEYMFVNKLQNFVNAPSHTGDSGSFRAYTSAIGLRIFNDYPLAGVGVGNSIYYMFSYEFRMGVISFGETLVPGVFPQNAFSSVLSEQGLIGGIFFSLFVLKMLHVFWVNRNRYAYSQLFLIGGLFNVVAMLAIAPVYSLFIWAFMAFGMGYIRHCRSVDDVVAPVSED